MTQISSTISICTVVYGRPSCCFGRNWALFRKICNSFFVDASFGLSFCKSNWILLVPRQLYRHERIFWSRVHQILSRFICSILIESSQVGSWNSYLKEDLKFVCLKKQMMSLYLLNGLLICTLFLLGMVCMSMLLIDWNYIFIQHGFTFAHRLIALLMALHWISELLSLFLLLI